MQGAMNERGLALVMQVLVFKIDLVIRYKVTMIVFFSILFVFVLFVCSVSISVHFLVILLEVCLLTYPFCDLRSLFFVYSQRIKRG